MKRIIRNTLAVIALTIGASQAKAQLASDAPSAALKAAPMPAEKPAAQVQTASSSAAPAAAKTAVAAAAIAQPAQGDVAQPSLTSAKASMPAPVLPPLQEGQRPKEAAAKPAIKAELPSQQK